MDGLTRFNFKCRSNEVYVDENGDLKHFNGIVLLKHNEAPQRFHAPIKSSVSGTELTVTGANGNTITVGLEHTIYNSPYHALSSINACNDVCCGSGGSGSGNYVEEEVIFLNDAQSVVPISINGGVISGGNVLVLQVFRNGVLSILNHTPNGYTISGSDILLATAGNTTFGDDILHVLVFKST